MSAGRNGSFQRSAHFYRIQLPYRAPEFLSAGVEENECGRILEAIKRSEAAPGIALDIHSDDDQAALGLFFDPIHDGFHRCAGNSVGRLELKQDGCALPNVRLDLGGIRHHCSLAWVQEDPRRRQSEHQKTQDHQLGPFRAPAQQDDPGDDHQESSDPNR